MSTPDATRNWLLLEQHELYALLAGDVPESVKCKVFDVTREACDARLMANVEKPERKLRRRTT